MKIISVIASLLIGYNLTYAGDRIAKTNDVISQIQRIDLKIAMNNIIVKSKAEYMQTRTNKWFVADKYFESITEAIPNAICKIMSNPEQEKTFSFGSLDLSNYTQANYNALFLYNLINETVKYLSECSKDGKNLFENTKNIIEENFQNINYSKLAKAMQDIKSYNEAFDIIKVVDELYNINEQITLARHGKSNIGFGLTSYITNNSELRYNIKGIEAGSVSFNLPTFDYLIFKCHEKYPYTINKIELCFKNQNGIAMLDKNGTVAKMQEHNRIVETERAKHLQNIKNDKKFRALCKVDWEKYKPQKKVLTDVEKLEVEEMVRRKTGDYSLSKLLIDNEILDKIGHQLGIEIYGE